MTAIRLNTKLISMLHRVLFVPPSDIMHAANIPKSTWYRIMQSPELITIQQLLGIANGLHIPVRRFFSQGHTDVIGRRDNYVTDPYAVCRYDSDALQKLVASRAVTTWQQMADATSISRTNLRRSLTAETRTPVERFLIICRICTIDPFSILVDPNPEIDTSRPKKKNSRNAGDTPEDLLRDVKDLYQRVEKLEDRLDATLAKYNDLLKAHTELLHHISVNIDTINNSHVSIAAEREGDYTTKMHPREEV